MRFVLSAAWATLAATLLTPPVARAGLGLDPELTTPYRWRVVVQFAPNPLFTPAYRAQLLADTRAALQPALGEVGTVEVADLAALLNAGAEKGRDPLIAAFAEAGWPALDSTKFRELTGVKTHFLKLTVVRDAVRLEARQHDGSTGLTLPVLRSREARDPQTVSRLAGLMLGRDFGPVATVEVPERESDTVKVRFRGGLLPGFERQVKVGDVLIVAEVNERRRPDPPRNDSRAPRATAPAPLAPLLVAKPREYTLLRLETAPADGVARCRVFTRFNTAFTMARGLVGVRAMRLAPSESAVEFRVVDLAGKPPAAGTPLQVRASDVDFSSTAEARDRLELRDGLFRSGRPLRNMACVVVTVGASKGEQLFPVPILDGAPVTLKFAVDPKLAAAAEYENRLEGLFGRVVALQDTQLTLVKELARLIVAGKNPLALERAVGGLATVDALDKVLADELAQLKAAAEAAEGPFAAELSRAESRLQQLREGRPAIEQKVEGLRKTVGRVTDTVAYEKEFAAKEITLRIARLLAAGEVPEALEEFDQLYNLTKQEATKEQKAKVEAEWAPRNEEHRKARDFVLGAWRQLADLSTLTGNLDRLQESAKTLAENQDRLGLRNLLTALDQTFVKLKEIFDRLDPATPSDEAATKELKALSEALKRVEDAALAKVRAIENPK